MARDYSVRIAGGAGVLAATLMAAVPLLAQSAELDAVARAFERNRQALAQYRWSSRSEVRIDGEVPAKLPKKVQAIREELETLASRYMAIDDGRVRAMLRNAHAWEGRGEHGELLQVQVRGVVLEGDQLDLWVDSWSKLPRRIEALTSLRGEPVRITAEFEDLRDGPTPLVRSRIETELKEKKLSVLTENTGFEPR